MCVRWEGAASVQLCDGWYAAIYANKLRRDKPLALRRFGKDLVAWRDNDGRAVVMEDTCPHRSAKLSLGKIQNNAVVCPFHGFEFGNDGRCTLVPETTKAAPNLRCNLIPSLERNGFIWLFHGVPGLTDSEPPWFDELNDQLPYSQLQSEWTCHITRCIENQLDYAHLPFVHTNTIGGDFDVTNQSIKFDLREDFIKLDLGTGFFCFKFPNIWMLEILPKKFYQFIAFVPVDENNTLILLRAYQSFVTVPGLRNILGAILKVQSSVILNQDKRVVLSQTPRNSLLADEEKLYRSDDGIAYFRQVWQEKSKSEFKSS